MEGLPGSTLIPTPLSGCRLRCNVEGPDCLTWYSQVSSGNARTLHGPPWDLVLATAPYRLKLNRRPPR